MMDTLLQFSLSLQMSSNVVSVASPSHPIVVKLGQNVMESSSQEFDSTKAYVSLSSVAPLEKDIIVVITSPGLDKPRCMTETFNNGEEGESAELTRTYALTFVPRFDLPPLPEQGEFSL